MATHLTIPLDGNWVNIVRQFGSDIKDVLKCKYECSIDFIGVESALGQDFRQSRNQPPVIPEKRFSIKLNTLVLSVWKADLTTFKADAVVNAANDRLEHIGGLALALSKAGGPDVQRDSERHMRKHGRLTTGDAVIGNPGSLNCKNIIHAVGPCLPYLPSQHDVIKAKPFLEKAIRNILECAKLNGFKSVAIPALSSGLYNFPVAICADIIVDVLTRFDKKLYKDNIPYPVEIFLVNNDEPTVNEMERACRCRFVGMTKPVSQMVQSKINSSGAQTAESLFTVIMGNVRLTLRKGLIEDQQTDVIVNTTGVNLSLSNGEISKAILKKAGKKMQEEIDTYKSNRNRLPPVLETQPYGLHCKKVYHYVAMCAEAYENRAQQMLLDVIHHCLWMASEQGYTSIAFPAIGTGKLGFRKDDVAIAMTRAVQDIAMTLTRKMDVHFVIYPKENDTFTAFEARIQKLQGRSSHGSAEGGPRGSDEQNTSVAPEFKLSGPWAEANEEASRWLKALLRCPDSAMVNNNFIQYLGEEKLRQLKSDTELTTVELIESFERGCAQIKVQASSPKDVVVPVLKVEAMLCDVQKEFVRKVEACMPSAGSSSWEDMMLDKFDDRKFQFERQGRCIQRVLRFANQALKDVFELKKKQLGSSATPRRMYQRIPAQFCSMLKDIGFQREFAPPDDPAYGEGIYFAGSVVGAVDLWQQQNSQDVYEYYVQAQVMMGKSTGGKPDMIMPPPIADDPLVRYDSLTGGRDIAVIFNGHQALPDYIFICKNDVL